VHGTATLRLTSMMDILTTLLLFLLKSFVMEGEVITPVPGVNLPASTSEATPQASVVIAIFDDAVMIDGEVVAHIKREEAKRDLLIEPLAERLEAARAQSMEIARLRGGDADFHGKVSIQGDRDIHFAILQRVMYTCSASGYEEISLAVLRTT
jgi:biopolymer transport protein ExbD